VVTPAGFEPATLRLGSEVLVRCASRDHGKRIRYRWLRAPNLNLSFDFHGGFAPRNQSSNVLSQLSPGTFLNKSYPGFEPTDKLLVRLNEPDQLERNRAARKATRGRRKCVPQRHRCSLIAKSKFPVSSEKFPVLMRREFGRKRLTYISENEGIRPVWSPNPRKFPVFSQLSGNLDRRDAFTLASKHSHLFMGFLALSRHSPKRSEEAQNCATNWRSFSLTRGQRARRSGRTPVFSQFISTGHFRGSH
jgi:hypothetical protein